MAVPPVNGAPANVEAGAARAPAVAVVVNLSLPPIVNLSLPPPTNQQLADLVLEEFVLDDVVEEGEGGGVELRSRSASPTSRASSGSDAERDLHQAADDDEEDDVGLALMLQRTPGESPGLRGMPNMRHRETSGVLT